MKKQRRTWITAILALVLTLSFTTAALAFSDLKEGTDKDKITELHKLGIVGGVGGDLYAPDESMTYAQAVQIIVKGLGLNIDPIRFIKKPEASDSFDKVPNDAWYANAFIVATYNGLQLSRDIDPEKPISREAYANLLAQAMWSKGDYAFVEMWMIIQDESDIDKGSMDNIQKLLIAHIAKLDGQQRFLPKQSISRGEAAVMLYDARTFVADHKPLPGNEEKVTLTVDTVNSDVQKLTLSWGTKPNPGYRLTIDQVDFTTEGKAVVYYSLHYPEPDTMYPAVIVEPKAVTYISAKLKPEIEHQVK